jgi:very-short-patch-repair endonuclease
LNANNSTGFCYRCYGKFVTKAWLRARLAAVCLAAKNLDRIDVDAHAYEGDTPLTRDAIVLRDGWRLLRSAVAAAGKAK